MQARERVKLVRSLECADAAVESIDEDRSVCKTLSMLHPDIFTNGGDQFNDQIPKGALSIKHLEKPQRRKAMSKKVVVASGYFDPMHYGHVEYLQRSKDLGDTLIVIVNSDSGGRG